jgi:DNA protecting protein DprA
MGGKMNKRPAENQINSPMLPFFDGQLVTPMSEITTLHPNPDFDVHFLALAQLHGLGFRALEALIGHFSDLSQVWSTRPTELQELFRNAKIPGGEALASSISSKQKELVSAGLTSRDYFGRRNIHLIQASDPRFPQRLLEIPDYPKWLFVEGDISIANQGSYVAIVGTRQASEVGETAAEEIASLVSQRGLGVVSGLAEGIDAAVHTIAVRRSIPQIAVLGTGIEVTFPATTKELRHQIVSTGGCVVTEYLPSETYGRSNFVHRNRIQVGLSEAVCPVEGRSKSGTMHTVKFAKRYGRRLFGVTRGLSVSGNDIVAELKAVGAPVFDLSSDSGRAVLLQLLDTLPGERFERMKPPDLNLIVESVRRALVDFASYDELTRSEKQIVLKQIEKELTGDDKR